jgi:hypothetical protein
MADFDDPQHPAKLPITSYRLAGTLVSLHKACRNLVMLEVRQSVSAFSQAIGRLFRMKQHKAVRAWLITVDETYDQVVQWRAAIKYMPQLRALADVTENLRMNECFKHCSRIQPSRRYQEAERLGQDVWRALRKNARTALPTRLPWMG